MNNKVLKTAAAIGCAATLAFSSFLGAASATFASTTTSGALFITSSSSTDSPAIHIDGNGGMHLAFAGYYTGIYPGDDPNQPGFYAYCAPNVDCSVPANWALVPLGSHVQAAQLQLTPAGQPRLLFEIANGSSTGSGTSSYWYAACEAGCTDPNNWTMIDLADTQFIDATILDQTKHSFALDAQGHPRLVYGSGTFVYAACDAACTDTTIDPGSGQTVPANWMYTVLSNNLYVNEPTLAFTSLGEPRLTGFVYNPSDYSFNVDYLECNGSCGDSTQWTLTTLMPEGQSPLGISMRLDATDRAGLAVSQSNQLWYYQCGTGCGDPDNWNWVRFDPLGGSVSDADLAFDAQNEPHLALRSTGGVFGWGLAHIYCTASCTTPDANWTGYQVEDTSRLSQDLPLVWPANCLTGGWFGDFRPSIAFDAAGNASFAFDNQYWYAGCTDTTAVRTEFEGVRVVYDTVAVGGAPQGTAHTRTTAALPARRTTLSAVSHGKGAIQSSQHVEKLVGGGRASHKRPHVTRPAVVFHRP